MRSRIVWSLTVSGWLLCLACCGGKIVPRVASEAVGGSRVLNARLYATDATNEFADIADTAN